jgi:outer membrane immunogenic protein
MKKLLLASVAIMTISASALAADLPRRSAAPYSPAPTTSVVTAVPSFTWVGFYAGLHAGYVWSDITTRVTPPLTVDGDGFMFGAQAGYNAQFGALVAGVEGDISWTDVGGSATGAGGTSFHADLDWLATARGRLGVSFDRALVYGTAGFAFGDTNYRVASGGVAGASSDVSTGYALGAGVEWAFTNNLTAKAEWLYYDLGRDTVKDGAGFDHRVENDGSLGRVGLNVKF